MFHAHWAYYNKKDYLEINYIPIVEIYRKGNPDS